jgi:hypothetical protein
MDSSTYCTAPTRGEKQGSAQNTAPPQEAKRLAGRLAEIDAELISLLERWEALEAKVG